MTAEFEALIAKAPQQLALEALVFFSSLLGLKKVKDHLVSNLDINNKVDNICKQIFIQDSTKIHSIDFAALPKDSDILSEKESRLRKESGKYYGQEHI